ncbi:MAG TPA: hypothetical protein VEZ47_12055 [Gemmatirosa sp.]|nr:hypothetical protein [Gemmatirosa sp.]
MPRSPALRAIALAVLAVLVLTVHPAHGQAPASRGLRVEVTYPASRSATPLDGRLLLLVSTDSSAEPRFQVSDAHDTQLVFGVDVDGWRAGEPRTVDASADAYPVRSLAELPRGRYRVQALLNRYETFRRADGHVVKLPPDRGEGQQWNRKPGNLYSTVRTLTLDPSRPGVVRLALDTIVPPVVEPRDTRYVKHVRVRSERLSRFWGRDVFLGAHVLLPEGWDARPAARYPLVVHHGHFPANVDGWRETPPDSTLAPDSSARFRLKGYNRIQQQAAWDFHRWWTGPEAPRVLLVQIQHATPYYDDSYAVNSANTGPYGDAIQRELIPELERRFRGIGAGWARATYGGSTGGWEALAVQTFYPDEWNGAWVACPDPVDFRAYTVVDLYADSNAYWAGGPWKRTARPGHRDWLGHVSSTIEQANRRELALGTRGRSGDQWDVWQATYSPVGRDGYPQPIWDKRTGRIDPQVAAYWRERYDLSHILRRDWATLGPKLRGKLQIHVGDMDNYYLNDAVYLLEDFLRSATPPAEATVSYGDRAEHCWNGDPTRPNALSRLRYPQLVLPWAAARMRRTAPPGADTVSWRY